MHRLFGKQPRVLESHRLDEKGQPQPLVGNRPFGGHLFEMRPAAAPLFAPPVKGVQAGTGKEIPPRGPKNLRVGPQEIHVLPALQLIAVPRSDDGIIRPVFRYPHVHTRSALSRRRVPRRAHRFIISEIAADVK